MGFSSVKDFIFLATKKYKLDRQALGALVCEKTRQIIAKNFPQYTELWEPKKFADGKLSISAKNSSASSELFLKTNQLLDFLHEAEIPAKIEVINIVKE